MITVKSVDALPNARLRITLSSGRVVEVDVSEYLDEPGHTSLAKPAFFRKVGVEEWGHGVSWPDDIGIPVDALLRLAQEQAGLAWPTQFFNAWMKRHGLSESKAAKELGLTKKRVTRYLIGATPIPKYIELACEGWELRLSK